jgi:hypothetical protein
MTKTIKVEGPLHVICQCDKCKPQIAFNAKVVGYVEPQREWASLIDDEIDQGLLRSNYAMQTAGAWRDGVEWATKQLKEKKQMNIIEMARQAGVRDDGHIFEFSKYKYLERFANLVAAHEREECAKICEESWQGSPKGIAEQIRARGTT